MSHEYPTPIGELAKWGLVLQELDLCIRYRPGKKNANADALSRVPPRALEANEQSDTVLLAAVLEGESGAKGGDNPLIERERQDPKF